MTTVLLHALAHARTGDKGDRACISLIAYAPQHWPLLVEQVTEARVAGLFAHRRPTAVVRYLLPRLHAMNFVLDGVLDGGVNGALNLDSHGKTLSGLLLGLPIRIADDFADGFADNFTHPPGDSITGHIAQAPPGDKP